MKKFLINLKNFKKNTLKTSDTIGELANLYDEIFQNFNDFDCNIMHGEEYNVQPKDTYVSFNNYLIKWSK